MMGRRPWFLKFLVVSCLLALCFSHGLGRTLMGTVDRYEDSSVSVSKETRGKPREMIELMDYSDPVPNVNPRTGYIFTPPPQRN